MLITLAFAAEVSGQWLSGYHYRREISINAGQVSGSEALVDYPFLVDLVDPDLKSALNGGLVLSEHGWDISFTLGDGSTLLDHEVELFIPASGNLVAWVRIPALSATEDTEIYMYFGNPSVISDPSTASTWSTNFRGVWHFSDNTEDASQYSNHGKNNGTISTSGRIGRARNFDGIDDHVLVPFSESFDEFNNISVEAWVRVTDTTDYYNAILTRQTAYDLWYAKYHLMFNTASSNLEYEVNLGENTWYHVAATYDKSVQKIFLNGEEVMSSSHSEDISDEDEDDIFIGYASGSLISEFSGDIDEVRLHSVPLTEEWIKTSYSNQHTPDAFSSAETAESFNDFPCDAIVLPVENACTPNIFSNQYATDSGIPLTECDGYSGGDVWFKLEVPVSDSLVVKIESEARSQSPMYAGWAHQLGLAVYHGSCGSLTYDTCWIQAEGAGPPNNPEMLLSGFTPGDTLFLRVWEYDNDFNGKFRICAFADVDGPTITCPADIESQADSGSCLAALFVPAPVASSPNGISSVVNDYNGTDDASDDYPLGSTEVLWTVTDSLGISAFCSHTITVSDLEAPSITCPDNRTAFLDSNDQFIVPDYTGLVYYSDNCDPDPLISQFPSAGSVLTGDTLIRQIVINVEDSSSNTAQCQFFVQLEDSINPSITCPGDITEYINDQCEFIIPDYTALVLVESNYGEYPVFTQIPDSGTMISGSMSTEIVLEALFEDSITAECSFNLLLQDTIRPSVASLNDTSILLGEGIYKGIVSLPVPAFTDNCGVQTIVNDFNGGEDATGEYTVGTTTVVYTVTDVHGNIRTFTQQVTLQTVQEPELGLVIPEGFSPNEDGLNDRFEILGLDQYPYNELRVFNVHGNEVYQMTGYDNSWDGTSASNLNKGGRLPSGTYYYTIYLGVENAIIKGFVYLRRE